MNEPLSDLRARDRDQGRASDPSLSAWVSANAGSGKTHVLVQRVIRLLLERTPPSKLLCLTFTKAAAANMSARVFERLARWTRLEDRQLAGELAELIRRSPSAGDLEYARQLFARTVETPGGLKIQTIHAFCERLLHLFPFEANVAARFEVIEDLRRDELLSAARRDALAEALRGGDGRLGRGVGALADETSATEFGEILAAAVAQRRILADLDLEAHADALRRCLGLEAGADEGRIEAEIVHGGIAPGRWAAAAEKLGEKGHAGPALARAAAIEGPPAAQWEAYAGVFLTGGKARDDRYITKAARDAHPDLCQTCDGERSRVLALLEHRRAAATVRRTDALLVVGQAVARRYAALKSRAGLLDFDDLIASTLTLLRRAGSAWVLYKLDAGIDHILVDEAQDTSPQQWEILKLIAGEFTAGAGARRPGRTFFAVGDEKQSIFSFQGAAPREFNAMRRYFEQRITAAAAQGPAFAADSFAHVRLNWSFRSAPAVLRCVDDVFALTGNFKGLSFDPSETKTTHQAWKQLPGRVEIWDTVKATGIADPQDWSLPVDVPGGSDPVAVLADRIADSVQRWTTPDAPERVHGADGAARRVCAGDVLILVRTRSALFDAAIRALKRRAIPVAGADRMILNDHIAVMDLIACARAALLRADDLSLACVLKSPLIGLDDDALLELAPGRGSKSLADALAKHPDFRVAAATIEGWRRQVRSLTPFDFFMARVTDGARRQFGARLGPEAEDAVDEFLRRALEHERQCPPSMVRFLAAVDAADLEIKRDMEAAGNSVRVMTVHGAKGLEAKIVILADTCSLPTGRQDPRLFALDAPGAGAPPLFAWSARKADDPAVVAAARGARRDETLCEYRRLLYVAMTRAEERLIIAGHEGEPKKDGSPRRSPKCWYSMIHAALAPGMIEAAAPWNPAETILVHAESGPGRPQAAAGMSFLDRADLPEWATRKAPSEVAPDLVRPSRAAMSGNRSGASFGDDAAAADASSQALAMGRLTHTLLQHLPALPAAARATAAYRFTTAKAPPDAAVRLADAALTLIASPWLAPLFGPQSRAEVPVAGTLSRPDGNRIPVAGRIDRLAVLDDELWIADFKTGEPGTPRSSPAYVEQLALYRGLLTTLYPGRRMRAFLIWVFDTSIHEVESERLDAALLAMFARRSVPATSTGLSSHRRRVRTAPPAD